MQVSLSSLLFAEGGWASIKTQSTAITPQVIASARENLQRFQDDLNKFLVQNNAPEIEVGAPVGSGTYYLRDLERNPDKVYGDIDVTFYIQPIPGLTNNQTTTFYSDLVKKFSEQSGGVYDTTNGTNVIFDLGDDRYVQVDLVSTPAENKDWGRALAPEWNYKGILSSSLYSSLAEALNLSIGVYGVQAKTVDGALVKFGITKGTTLHTVTTDRANWAVDIVKWLGVEPSSLLLAHPGMKGDEVKIADIVASIKGIADSLNDPGLVERVRSVYLRKLETAATASKFDKAATPEAREKAEATKQMLRDKSQKIAALLS